MSFRTQRFGALLVAAFTGFAGGDCFAQPAPAEGPGSAGGALALIRAGNPALVAELQGMSDAFAVANSFLRIKGQAPLFCVGRGLKEGEHVEILEAHVRRYPDQRRAPTPIALAYAMVARFPC